MLAIVFAGNGVFELQNAGILLTTNLAWMGRGLPLAGLYPNSRSYQCKDCCWPGPSSHGS